MKGRILIVEDHPVNQKVLGFQLEELGLDFAVAETGLAALAALKSGHFDLVLMDWQLPEMDGLEATRRIRNELGLGDLPVIALSANSTEGFRETCLDAGANDYLGKPYTDEDLNQVLGHWLQAETVKPAELLDRAALAARYPNNPELLADLTRLFLSTSQTSLANLKREIRTRDAHQVEREAHALRGAAASVLATDIQQLATDIELAARIADWQKIEARLADLLARFERV